MIDNEDCSSSTLRLLVGEALKNWNTDSILRLLRESDYIVRTAAARELQIRGEQKIFDAVITLINSKEIFEREIGAYTLGQLGTPKLPFKEKSLPLLIELLDDESDDIKAVALTALGHLGGEHPLNSKLLPKISSFINHPSREVRISCAFSLGSFSKNSGSLEILEKMLTDPDNEVTEWAEVSIEIINER